MSSVVTLVRCEGNIFLGIVQVYEIVIDHLSVLEIRRFPLNPLLQFSFRVYQMVEITDTNDADYS